MLNKKLFNKKITKGLAVGAIGLGIAGFANIAKPASAGANEIPESKVEQIYNNDAQSWGFSYNQIPSNVVSQCAEQTDNEDDGNTDYVGTSWTDPLTHNRINEVYDDGGIYDSPELYADNTDNNIFGWKQDYDSEYHPDSQTASMRAETSAEEAQEWGSASSANSSYSSSASSDNDDDTDDPFWQPLNNDDDNGNNDNESPSASSSTNHIHSTKNVYSVYTPRPLKHKHYNEKKIHKSRKYTHHVTRHYKRGHVRCSHKWYRRTHKFLRKHLRKHLKRNHYRRHGKRHMRKYYRY